jgi:predicted RNA-binding protein YlxR (DUF448 family)
MAKGRGHTPLRRCICCGKKRKKEELIRLVINENGSLVRDQDLSAPGRGRYICDRADCISSLIKNKGLEKAPGKEGSIAIDLSILIAQS